MPNPNTIHTEICVLGGGAAGMVLANVLHEQNIPCAVIEQLDPEAIKAEGRAGIIEWTTVKALQHHGLAERMLADHRTQGQCEFRSADWQFQLDYAALNGGKTHTVYPQTDLVHDLAQVFEQRGGRALYRTEAQSIAQSNDGVTVGCIDCESGQSLTVKASLAVGCDGARGISKRALPQGAVAIYHQDHNIHWLAILAEAKPFFPHTLYAMHPDGMAAFLMRNDNICRYYLQIDASDDAQNWTQNKIWQTLEQRFFMGGEQLHRGNLQSVNKLSLRSVVTDPMRHGRLFLAGDAAHLIPPTGAKGMNLAIHDVLTLADLFGEFFSGKRSLSQLNEYSELRLPLIWKAQNFSLQLMHMIHKPPSTFEQQLWTSKLHQLQTSPKFAAQFSTEYVATL